MEYDWRWYYLEGPIPKCVGNLSTSLVILHFNANKLSGLIPSTFRKNCSIESINLNGNKLEGSIPQSIINCQGLRGIDIGDNEMRGAFPFWMETLPQLRILILRSNKFDGTMLVDSNTQQPFQKLQVLDVSQNAFVGSLPNRYFKNFRGMIDAKENQTDSEAYWFLRLIELKITVKGLEQLLERLLTTFTTIDLSSNKFSGSIPPSVGNLNSLRYLNLSHNTLKEHIPPSLGGMGLLESLDLSSNKLDGKIPGGLARLTFLAKLNLSMNNLKGEIPQSTQLSTFGNESYVGNVGLCGFPLTKKCAPSDGKPVFPRDDEYEFIDGFGWQCVVMGYGSGFVVGIGIGYMIIRSGRPRWLVEFFYGVGYKYKTKKRRHKAAPTRRGT
ncbi:receptor-like protein Cf-9 homolog [Salvia hispanica]|uniref:receptor-like protein Cf-9 homolog n=1 Tax=Salvia hispanica TaxID=49212 RepID=UPI0020091428|nr:receptor-like protein Cf-9 homolog [Salvia hispanica]